MWYNNRRAVIIPRITARRAAAHFMQQH